MTTRTHLDWTRLLTVTAAAILALAAAAHAVTYDFTLTTPGAYNWSTGTGWSATPVSADTTTLRFFPGITFNAGTSGAYTLNNDNAGTFALNRLELQGSGGAGAGTTTVNITGNQLSFVRNGLTDPVIDIWATSFAGGPLDYTLSNNLHLADDTTILSSNASNNVGATFTLGGTITGRGDLTINATTPNGSHKLLRFSGTANNTRLYNGDITINGGDVTFNPSAGAGFQFYTAGDLTLNGGTLRLLGSGNTMSVFSFSGTGGAIVGSAGGTTHTLVVNDANPTAKSYAGTVQRDMNFQYLGAGALTMPLVTSGDGGLSNGAWTIGGVGKVSTPGIAVGRAPLVVGAKGTMEVTGTSGVVLGTVLADTTMQGGTIRVAPSGSGASVTVSGYAANSRVFLNSGDEIELDKGGNNSLAVNVGGGATSALLNRGTGGTLVIKPASGLANLGTAAGETLRITAAAGLPPIVNGIVPAWIVGQDTNGKGDFLTYDGTGSGADVGFKLATYTHTNTFTGVDDTSVLKVDTAAGTVGTQSVRAMRVDGTVTINAGHLLRLELTNGGVILNGGTITGGGTFQVGVSNTHQRQYTFYAGADGGTIASTINFFSQGGVFSGITDNVALVKFGEGTLALTGSVNATETVKGQIMVNEGALRFNANMANLSFTDPTILLNGGVIETSGSFTRALTASGNSGGGVNLGLTGSSPGGGFSAFGGALSVNLGGAGAQMTWASTNFVGNFGLLMLNSKTANDVVDWQNPIALGVNSAQYFRQVYVEDNPNVTTDRAVISGAITDTAGHAGTHGLQKVGAGLLSLTGSNTYAGKTAVSQGTLLVDGTHTGGNDYDVYSGATLGGSGSIATSGGARVSILGGTITAAEVGTIGTLTLVTDLLIGAGSTMHVDLDALTSDLLSITGRFDIAPGATIDINVLGTPTQKVYTLVTFTAGYSGAFDTVLNVPNAYSLVYRPDALYLAIPEPATAGLLALGLGLLTRRHRRGAGNA